MVRRRTSLLLVFSLALIAGCGGGNSGSVPSRSMSVTSGTSSSSAVTATAYQFVNAPIVGQSNGQPVQALRGATFTSKASNGGGSLVFFGIAGTSTYTEAVYTDQTTSATYTLFFDTSGQVAKITSSQSTDYDVLQHNGATTQVTSCHANGQAYYQATFTPSGSSSTGTTISGSCPSVTLRGDVSNPAAALRSTASVSRQMLSCDAKDLIYDVAIAALAGLQAAYQAAEERCQGANFFSRALACALDALYSRLILDLQAFIALRCA
jgi:hypothetical protein